MYVCVYVSGLPGLADLAGRGGERPGRRWGNNNNNHNTAAISINAHNDTNTLLYSCYYYYYYYYYNYYWGAARLHGDALRGLQPGHLRAGEPAQDLALGPKV